MGITERQKNILDALIREYVAAAAPISSQSLERKYDFGVCPATIRAEMQKLTDDGYLAQPHTSAGRVPTDKGYRYFVNSLMDAEKLGVPNLDFEMAMGLDGEFEDIFRASRDLARGIAAASESLVIGYMANEGVTWKEGWEEVLRQPEFSQKNLMDNFLDYLNYIESNIEKIKPAADFDLSIGRENPYPKAEDFATFSLVVEPIRQEEVVFSIIGPKRMAYDKNIALVNQVMKMFDF